MDFYNKQNFSVENKEGFENFVTDADKDAEDLIKAELMKHFPDHGFRAEETANDSSDKEFVWIVDPMDGTRHFVQRKDTFTILIGLAHKGKPILGVVYAPNLDKLYWAEKGKGAFLNGERIRTSNINKPTENRVACSQVFKRDEELRSYYNKIPRKSFEFIGSAGYKVCLVADGTKEFYLGKANFLKEWDLCARAIILEEAGGKITHFDGRELVFNKEEDDFSQGFIASNGKMHEELLKFINS